jgi:glycerophosphoryl diester phosphodiesterase
MPSHILPDHFTVQSHRGARGLMPENTIPAFLKSLECGVTIMEFDLVVTGCGQLLVSHEAWFSADFSTHRYGFAVEQAEEKNYNIYRMNYADIRQFDCGKRRNPRFAQQQTMPTYKPLWTDMIAAVEEYALLHRLDPVIYNVEIKTEGETADHLFQPPPLPFAQLVYDTACQQNIANRCIIQSFDVRLVQAMRRIAPEMPLSLLVENTDSFEDNLRRLGFIPDFYTPYYALISPELVYKVHANGMKLMTWTVNDLENMEYLRNMGVDSIITDYPNLYAQLRTRETTP